MQQGVRHMAYCPDHRLIVSGGFSFDLVINNQYDSTPISRLHGHTAPIVGVDHLKGTCQASYTYWPCRFQRGGLLRRVMLKAVLVPPVVDGHRKQTFIALNCLRL